MKKQGTAEKGFLDKLFNDLKVNAGLYVLILPAFVFLILFAYVPMYGILLAFKEYDSSLGIMGSEWVGLYHFGRFFRSYYSSEVILNTVTISLYSLVVGFVFPIILALLLNSVGNLRFKKTVQMISYAPYFISTVVIVAMIEAFFDSDMGTVVKMLERVGVDVRIDWLISSNAFQHVYVWSGLWQTLGWNSIIYISALSGVSPELYEAATIDGATKFHKIIYIDIPSIMPTMVTLLILSVGNILSVGFEKVYLMQNENNLSTSEVISTYVYKKGILAADYGLGSAVGLFNAVINFIMLATVNFAAKKLTDYSIW
ncbi:MAG: sugar ABC transporter permease [Clostridia bacterium]|nr:sugar ABC transporter permease [Clostridia bacterium]MBR2968699.1 sugar ABC transporter permease [Clostridia bacterium]